MGELGHADERLFRRRRANVAAEARPPGRHGRVVVGEAVDAAEDLGKVDRLDGNAVRLEIRSL